MKYIIMADGKGKRWNNHGGIPKHFVKIDDERIIERTIRLLKENDSNKEIIVTSHDKKYDFENATRYEPKIPRTDQPRIINTDFNSIPCKYQK